MKKITILSFILCTVVSWNQSVQAQKLDKIISKHINAMGGIEKYDQIQNLKITGNFTAFSEEKPFEAYKTSDGKYFSKHYLGQHKVVEGFNGKEGWTIDPWFELPFPRALKKAEHNAFLQKADFNSPFFHYKEKGYKLELLDKKEEEGTACFAIKLTRYGRFEETWFLDAKTYLPFKVISHWADFSSPSLCESFFEDYREVNGVKFPFYIERIFGMRNRVHLIENIEVNPNVSDIAFNRPQTEEMKKLAFLEGDWTVEIEIMTRRGKWYKIGETDSQFSYTDLNCLSEDINYQTTEFMTHRKMNYSFHPISGKYRVSSYNDFVSSFDLYEGNFNDTALVLQDTEIRYAKEENREYNRFNLKQINEDKFIVEHSSSKDGGENWKAKDRFTYIRKK